MRNLIPPRAVHLLAAAAGIAVIIGAFAAFSGGAGARVIDPLRITITFPTEVDSQVPPGRDVPVDIRLTALIDSESGAALSEACIASADSGDLETPIDDTAIDTLTTAASDADGCNASTNDRGTYITVPAGTFWKSNGDTRLRIDGFDAQLDCDKKSVAAGGEVEVFCQVRTTAGSLPVLTVPDDYSRDEVTVTVQLASAADGENAGSGSFYLSYTDDATKKIVPGADRYSDSARLSVGRIVEVASVDLSFDRAPSLALFTAERGEQIDVNLAILNENGRAADPASVLSVTLVATKGMLESPGTSLCDGASVCNFTSTQLVAAVSAAGDPELPGRIRLRWTAPREPGEGRLSATVLSASDRHAGGPIDIHVPGPARSYSIAEPAAPVHYKDVGDDVGDTRGDARDQLRLKLQALDDAQGVTRVPANPPSHVVNSAGSRVPITDVQTRITCADSARTECTLEIDVDDADGIELGDYAVIVGTGSNQVRRTFRVAGDAADLTVDWTPKFDTPVGSRITITATVVDRGGRPVADGTMVTFRPIPRESFLFKGGVADPLTEGGVASQVMTVINTGTQILSVLVPAADGISRTPSIDTGAQSVQTPVCGYENIASSQGGRTSWTGGPGCTASDVLAAVGSIQALWISSATGTWTGYGSAAGAILPGSFDFAIPPNATIWLVNRR